MNELIETARLRMSDAVEADRENREMALSDLRMLSGQEIWDEKDKSRREAEGRPCPVINRLPRFVRQVTGDIRKLNPAIKVLPGDDKSDESICEVYEGLIRQIQQDSGATNIYEGSAESAAQCGIGAFRVLNEFEDETSFNQVIKIERIHNPLSVYFDPASRQPTRSDAEFCFITDQISDDDFKDMFPKANPVDTEHDGETDGLECWRSDGQVVVAEYFWKERKTVEIGLLADGSTVENPTAIHNAVKTRKAQKTVVKWAKISGKDVLEGPKDLPGKHIPVVAVVGEEMHVGERVVRTSVIRHAKDPMRIYNYMAAAELENVAMQPKAPYMVTPKQIAGLEAIWGEANSANRPYLPFNPDEKAPPPQRVAPPIASGGLNNSMERAEDDMKATTGIYDAALGGRSNEQSGVAIRQRQLESDISTSIYTDNLAKAIEHCGNIIVEMIPMVYDTARMIRTLGEDDQQQVTPINAVSVSQDGVMPVNDLTGGKYTVRVTVGPNYSTRRQETAESMMQFVQAFPAAGQVAGDLIAKSMDWPDADKLAERLQKILPPGMIPPDQMTPEQQQEMQAGMAQQQQAAQIQQVAQEIEMRKAEAETTEAEADAQKAQTEAAAQAMELAINSGQLNGVIAQMVQQQVALALQGAMQPGAGPI